ncbi:hypothetical protein Ancab_022170, partial [Ancistrocladus abbreviatus]
VHAEELASPCNNIFQKDNHRIASTVPSFQQRHVASTSRFLLLFDQQASTQQTQQTRDPLLVR